MSFQELWICVFHLHLQRIPLVSQPTLCSDQTSCHPVFCTRVDLGLNEMDLSSLKTFRSTSSKSWRLFQQWQHKWRSVAFLKVIVLKWSKSSVLSITLLHCPIITHLVAGTCVRQCCFSLGMSVVYLSCSSMLAWRIPRTEEPGGLQSMGLQRVRLDWLTLSLLHRHSSSETAFMNPSVLFFTGLCSYVKVECQKPKPKSQKSG